MFVPDMLRKAAETYEERNKIYGDNYKHFGHIMARLFPTGIELITPDDHNRFGVFVQVVSKLTRYSANFEKGGHPDSLHDAIVYNAMLAELDYEMVLNEDKEQPVGYAPDQKAPSVTVNELFREAFGDKVIWGSNDGKNWELPPEGILHNYKFYSLVPPDRGSCTPPPPAPLPSYSPPTVVELMEKDEGICCGSHDGEVWHEVNTGDDYSHYRFSAEDPGIEQFRSR